MGVCVWGGGGLTDTAVRKSSSMITQRGRLVHGSDSRITIELSRLCADVKYVLPFFVLGQLGIAGRFNLGSLRYGGRSMFKELVVRSA